MKTFTQPIEVRYFDIDMNQHVNNAVYFTYMENARTELLMDEFKKTLKNGFTFVVSETSCKYHKPILLGNKVTCEMLFEQKRSVQFSVTYTFKNPETDDVYAVGHTLVVMVNKTTNRPAALPQNFIDEYIN